MDFAEPVLEFRGKRSPGHGKIGAMLLGALLICAMPTHFEVGGSEARRSPAVGLMHGSSSVSTRVSGHDVGRHSGHASASRSKKFQVLRTLTGQLGQLFIDPMVSLVWSQLDGDSGARPTTRITVSAD